MSQPTCRTCRWWGDAKAEGSGDYDYANVRVCLCPKIEFGIGDYDGEQSMLIAEDDSHVLSSDEAGVKDGSGYHAAFLPGPDFGCIHHQPKEPADART